MARRRVFWIGFATIAVALSLVIGFGGWTISPGSLKPRLIAAAARATGRTLTISGPVRIRLSLSPTISLEDVALANPPGSSRPDMMRVARVELRVGLLPLLWHQVRIDRITLVRPDLLLEGDHSGHANWLFQQPRPPVLAETLPGVTGQPVTGQPSPGAPRTEPGAATATQPQFPARATFAVSLRDISIEDGLAGLFDRGKGRRIVAAFPRLNVTASDGQATRIDGTIALEGQEFALTAETGPLNDLRAGNSAFPVAVRLESGGATVTARGQIANPLQARGYAFTVDAEMPSLSAVVAGLPPDALRAVTAHAEVADSANRMPLISALTVKAGSADLTTFSHDVRLRDIAITGRADAPLQVSARLTMAGYESGISGTAGDLAWLSNGGSGPVSVDLTWDAGSAGGTVKGTMLAPRRLADFALDVAATVPDPALVFDAAPPALKSVALHARLTDEPGPAPFQLTSNAGDLEGELTVSRSPRLSVEGTISSRRLDLDMLRARPAPVVAASGPAVSAPPSQGPLIPDTRLPFDRIRAVDADLKFSLASVRLGGTDIAGVNAALAVKDGVLRLDPFAIASPGQWLNGVLTVDTAEAPSRVHLTVESPGLPLGPLLAALDLPEAATGTVELHADLSGTGDSPHALAASLDGRAGVAIEAGQLNARTVDAWLERLRPLRIDGAGDTDLRCFAVRADAKSGVVTIQPLVLNTAALILEASGEVDLGQETLALHVRPRTKIGGLGIALPVRVSGPMRTPSAKADISSKGFGGGALAGLLLGGKDVMGAAGGGDPCPDGLARARATPPGEKP